MKVNSVPKMYYFTDNIKGFVIPKSIDIRRNCYFYLCCLVWMHIYIIKIIGVWEKENSQVFASILYTILNVNNSTWVKI